MSDIDDPERLDTVTPAERVRRDRFVQIAVAHTGNDGRTQLYALDGQGRVWRLVPQTKTWQLISGEREG